MLKHGSRHRCSGNGGKGQPGSVAGACDDVLNQRTVHLHHGSLRDDNGARLSGPTDNSGVRQDHRAHVVDREQRAQCVGAVQPCDGCFEQL